MWLRRLSCESCGAKLTPRAGAATIHCEYCGSTFAMPRAAKMPAPDAPGSRAKMQAIVAAIVLSAASLVGFVIYKSVMAGIPDSAFSLPDTEKSAPATSGAAEGFPGAKLHLVVSKCFNSLSPAVFRSRDRYLEWVDPDVGPRPRRHIYGITSIPDPAACQKTLDEATEMSPSRPALEAAARDYAKAAVAAREIVSEAVTYYDRGHYEDDDFARGIAMHEPLMERFSRFEKAHLELAAAIDKVFAIVVDEGEKRLRQAGDDTALLMLRTQLAAREIATLANISWRKLEALDVETYRAKVKGYQRMVDRLERIDGIEDRLDEIAFAGSRYVDKSQDLAEAARELLRRVAGNDRFSHGERMTLRSGWQSHWMVDGSPGKVLRAYNELAQSAPPPGLRWLPPIDLARP